MVPCNRISLGCVTHISVRTPDLQLSSSVSYSERPFSRCRGRRVLLCMTLFRFNIVSLFTTVCQLQGHMYQTSAKTWWTILPMAYWAAKGWNTSCEETYGQITGHHCTWVGFLCFTYSCATRVETTTAISTTVKALSGPLSSCVSYSERPNLHNRISLSF